jgi:response regulator RpfG family c-di-GMP phosphodiesterase
MEKINVLYVDDEVGNLNVFKASFRRYFNIFCAETAEEGLKILENNVIQIIMSDQRMPEMSGVEFLQLVLERDPKPIRILVTGYSDIEVVISAINNGQVYKYVAKPWNNDTLKILLNQSYEVYSLRKENEELTKSLVLANKQLEFMLRQKLIS